MDSISPKAAAAAPEFPSESAEGPLQDDSAERVSNLAVKLLGPQKRALVSKPSFEAVGFPHEKRMKKVHSEPDFS